MSGVTPYGPITNWKQLNALRETAREHGVNPDEIGLTMEHQALLKFMRVLATDNGVPNSVSKPANDFLWDIGERD